MTDRKRTHNDLTTPAIVLDVVRQLGPIALDPCSNPWSTVGAAVELDGSDEHRDGILHIWTKAGGLIFVNPPYGRGQLRRWADKIAAEAGLGCEIVALVPASTDTRWWQTLRKRADAICYWHGRLSFGGGECGAGTFPSALLYFGPRKFLFAHLFAPHGDVRVIA